MTFWSCRKNALIREITLTSELLTSQLGEQTITIQIFSNISLGKDKQTKVLGHIIEYNTGNIFL